VRTANRNTLWADIFVKELINQGLQAVCVAAGSRSTPLTLAFASSKEIQMYSHIDERSAAYFALGMARAGGKPVALVCTSGTAAANFYPAVIEANYSEVPLIVLSADRPHELRDSGSNQSIDQVKMYGGHVRWFVDVMQPEARPSQHLLRALKVLAARAWMTAQAPLPGPVHLNFPFRKPLEPTPVPEDLPDWMAVDSMESQIVGVQLSRGELKPTKEQIEKLRLMISQTEHGWIVCGPHAVRAGFAEAVTALAKVTGYPIMADALSGVRFGEHIKTKGVTFLAGYENYLSSPYLSPDSLPQLILRFGGLPISKALSDFMGNITDALQIHVTENGRWRDDRYRTNQVIWADPLRVCQELVPELIDKKHVRAADNWVKLYKEIEAFVWETAPEWGSRNDFEGGVLADVVEWLPPQSALYIGNSLPVRHLDQFVQPTSKFIEVFANRGASGIDGLVSSALGAAAVLDVPTVLIIGDLSFYHDLTGLMALQRYGIKATIVVINNNGGGLFHRLPVSKSDPLFSKFFLTPHGLDFEPIARMFGAEYAVVRDRENFRNVFLESINSDSAYVIEVPSDSSVFEKKRLEFIAAISNKLQEMQNYKNNEGDLIQ